jgi:large subunit ribosomal protein L29
MKSSEIRELGIDELGTKVSELSEELFRLKFKNGIRQLENTANLKAVRRTIARIKTIINEKKIKAA